MVDFLRNDRRKFPVACRIFNLTGVVVKNVSSKYGIVNPQFLVVKAINEYITLRF